MKLLIVFLFVLLCGSRADDTQEGYLKYPKQQEGYLKHPKQQEGYLKYPKQPEVASMRFLVSVNDTWGNCLATTLTRNLEPRRKYNYTDAIHVGSCDQGPLWFDVSVSGNEQVVSILFHSSVIEDASPPTCNITWYRKYLVPRHPGQLNQMLPGCYVEDSREGYHMTYYWFYIFDWQDHP